MSPVERGRLITKHTWGGADFWVWGESCGWICGCWWVNGSKSRTPGPSFEVLTSVLFGRGESMPNFCDGNNIWVSVVCGGGLIIICKSHGAGCGVM